MHDDSDSDDVALVRSGDREAFGRLYDRHARRVRSIVAAVSNDFNATDDLTQEVFLRAYRLIGRLRDPCCFGSWIGEIARRVARERRRSLHRDRHEFFGDTPGQAGGDDPATAASDRDAVECLLTLVAKLSEKERLVLHSHYFHEQRPEVAAEAIGLSRSGYYALLKRTHAKLRRCLESSISQPRGLR